MVSEGMGQVMLGHRVPVTSVEKQYSYLAGVQAWQGGPDAVERHHPQRPDVRQDEAAQDGR